MFILFLKKVRKKYTSPGYLRPQWGLASASSFTRQVNWKLREKKMCILQFQLSYFYWKLVNGLNIKKNDKCNETENKWWNLTWKLFFFNKCKLINWSSIYSCNSSYVPFTSCKCLIWIIYMSHFFFYMTKKKYTFQIYFVPLNTKKLIKINI